MDPILIAKDEHGFYVQQGDRYADWLCWDEMMGLLAELTMPKEFSHASWMKTEEQHFATKPWRYKDREQKPKETLLLEMK